MGQLRRTVHGSAGRLENPFNRLDDYGVGRDLGGRDRSPDEEPRLPYITPHFPRQPYRMAEDNPDKEPPRSPKKEWSEQPPRSPKDIKDTDAPTSPKSGRRSYRGKLNGGDMC